MEQVMIHIRRWHTADKAPRFRGIECMCPEHRINIQVRIDEYPYPYPDPDSYLYLVPRHGTNTLP